MSETVRAVYVQRLDPDKQARYVDAHNDVPEAVTDAMQRGGVESFELYVRDDIAVCILECADLDAYLDAVDGEEEVAEWERFTGQFKKSGVDVDVDAEDGIPFMKRIWEFKSDEV